MADNENGASVDKNTILNSKQRTHDRVNIYGRCFLTAKLAGKPRDADAILKCYRRAGKATSGVARRTEMKISNNKDTKMDIASIFKRTKLKRCWIVFILMILIICGADGQQCREQSQRNCEKLCYNGKCELRAALILPASTKSQASLPRVLPVFEIALRAVKEAQLLPENLDISLKSYDDKCDASFALISAIDAYAMDCNHVFFGPGCDYALASVARITKFLGSYGTPVLTVGGLTFDFVNEKTDCSHEYYTLTRTGVIGFRDITFFIIDMMYNYGWKKIVLVNEPNGQYQAAGKHTCHLMMKTMAQFIKEDPNLMYSTWDTTQNVQQNFSDNLRLELAMTYTSEYKWRRLIVLYEKNGQYESAGLHNCYLFTSTVRAIMNEEGGFTLVVWDILRPDEPHTDYMAKQIGNLYSSEFKTINYV